jgi:5-methylcytosine-specific restriction endonuclease McrA
MLRLERTNMALTMKLKLRVFQRDKWICFYCRMPVVFHSSMRLLQEFVQEHGFDGGGYYQRNWTHAYAPLLDYLGAVVDHIRPRAQGGKDTQKNLRTSCNKCNASKNDRHESKLAKPKKINSKYGHPIKWDGLSNLFVILADRTPDKLTVQERRWRVAIHKSKPS